MKKDNETHQRNQTHKTNKTITTNNNNTQSNKQINNARQQTQIKRTKNKKTEQQNNGTIHVIIKHKRIAQIQINKT